MKTVVGGVSSIGDVQIVANSSNNSISSIRFWISKVDTKDFDALIEAVSPKLQELEDVINQFLKRKESGE